MFYRIRENKIYDCSDCKYAEGCLENEIDYQEYLKNTDKYAVVNGTIQDISQTPEYIAEQIQKRKDAFYKDFIKTSKGCLRLKTKVGDLIALLPSITLGVQITGKLNANEIVLYPEPDFSIERTQEQMEKWLEENQYKNEEMTLQEYMLIVIEITQAIKSLFNS